MDALQVWYILSYVLKLSSYGFFILAIREYTNWDHYDPYNVAIYFVFASLLAYILLIDYIFRFCVWTLISSPGRKYNSLLAFARLTVLFLAAHHAAARASKDKLFFQLSFSLLIMSFTAYAAREAPDERGRNISKLIGAGCWGTALSLLDPNDFEPRSALFFFLSSIFCLGCNIFHPSYNQERNRIRGIRDFFPAALGIDNVVAAAERPEDQQANEEMELAVRP